MRKTKMGQEIISGLKEAIAYTKGLKRLRTTTLEMVGPAKHWAKEEIADLRRSVFGVSQPVFASLLSVTVSTVRAWEQGQKSPSGAARRLLEVAAAAPELFMRRSQEGFPVRQYAAQSPHLHSHVAERTKKVGKSKT